MRTPGTTGSDAERDVSVALLRETVLAGRRATQRAAAILAAEGFTVDEWVVLGALSDADGLSMSELRELAVVDKATLGRRVDLLVSKALVYREVDDGDRRVIRVYLSARGREVLSRLVTRLAQGE